MFCYCVFGSKLCISLFSHQQGDKTSVWQQNNHFKLGAQVYASHKGVHTRSFINKKGLIMNVTTENSKVLLETRINDIIFATK